MIDQTWLSFDYTLSEMCQPHIPCAAVQIWLTCLSHARRPRSLYGGAIFLFSTPHSHVHVFNFLDLMYLTLISHVESPLAFKGVMCTSTKLSSSYSSFSARPRAYSTSNRLAVSARLLLARFAPALSLRSRSFVYSPLQLVTSDISPPLTKFDN